MRILEWEERNHGFLRAHRLWGVMTALSQGRFHSDRRMGMTWWTEQRLFQNRKLTQKINVAEVLWRKESGPNKRDLWVKKGGSLIITLRWWEQVAGRQVWEQKGNQWPLSVQWDQRGSPGQWSTLGTKVGTGSLGGRNPSGHRATGSRLGPRLFTKKGEWFQSVLPFSLSFKGMVFKKERVERCEKGTATK